MNHMNNTGTKKNGYIELWRFIACLLVFSYHTQGIAISGWIFVEFFFMLSGYFAIRHFHNMPQTDKKANYPISYTLHKFSRIFPYTTLAFLYYAGMAIWVCDLKGQSLWLWLIYLPINLLLLPGTGVMPRGVAITEYFYTGHMMEESLWYLCVMVVAMPIMLYIIMYLEEKLGLFLFSFLPLILYGYLILSDGTINGWHEQHMTFFALDIRALAGLLAGGAVYYASLWWRKREYTVFGKLLLTLVEAGCMGIVVTLVIITRAPVDIAEILLIALSLSLTMSGRTYTAYITFKPLAYLGRLSLPIYCFHCTTFLLVQNLYADKDVDTQALLTFCLVLGASVITDFMIEKGRIIVKKYRKKMGRLLVSE